jgi:hypothetical protein
MVYNVRAHFSITIIFMSDSSGWVGDCASFEYAPLISVLILTLIGATRQEGRSKVWSKGGRNGKKRGSLLFIHEEVGLNGVCKEKRLTRHQHPLLPETKHVAASL